MNAKTLLLLEELEKSFLTSAGQDEVPELPWKSVSCISDVIKHITSPKFDNVQLEWRNQLTVAISSRNQARYGSWNNITREIKPHIIKICETGLDKMSLSPGDRKPILDSTRWDILALCMYMEYSDIVKHPTYDEIMKIYLAGRVLCGWRDGFIVY